MTKPYTDKFREYIDTMNLNKLYASDEEQAEMNEMDDLLETLHEIPLSTLQENLSISDDHLLNAIADLPIMPEPIYAIVLIIVLYRQLLQGDDPTEAVL